MHQQIQFHRYYHKTPSGSVWRARDAESELRCVYFFDIVTDDTAYEVLYEVPGWPRIIQGRSDGPVQGLLRKYRASVCR
jgi:hypothetical protein